MHNWKSIILLIDFIFRELFICADNHTDALREISEGIKTTKELKTAESKFNEVVPSCSLNLSRLHKTQQWIRI